MKNVIEKIAIAMISDDNFVMPTCVAITSLLKNKNVDSFYDIFILMAECSQESERRFNSFEGEGFKINLLKVSLEQYRDIKQLAHISIACLLKFDICDIISDYDKILYMDGDIIVRGDLSEFYNIDIQDKYAGAVKEINCIENDTGNVNAGIMLFNAKKIRDERLREKLVETRRGLGDRGSMDQQTFNIVTRKEYHYLPIKYNCVIAKLVGRDKDDNYTIDNINILYKTQYKCNQEVVDDALIVHFATSNKPWHYTFNAGAKEWYKYYMQSPYKDVPFKLRGIWSYRLNEMKKAFKKDGLLGIIKRIENKFKRILNKNGERIDWE